MPMLTITVTTYQCDGTEGAPCALESTAVYDETPRLAARLAAKAGWSTGLDIICPDCRTADLTVSQAPAKPSPGREHGGVRSCFSVVPRQRMELTSR